MSQTSEGTTVLVDGRIVWQVGKTLFQGRQKTIFGIQQLQMHPQTGEPVVEYGFGLAVPKSVLGQPGPDGKPGIWNALNGEALKLFPNGQIPPSFAMKYKDGDTIDEKGVPYSQREGYAGHIVIACTTRLPIKFFRHENGQVMLVNDGIKCGDYVRVQLQIKAHPAQGQGKAGLYVNPSAVLFLGYGTEIINAPSGDQIFGTTAPPLPAGASATPIAPPGAAFPAMPAPVVAAAPVPGAPIAYPQPAAPAQPVPHYGVLPPNHQPPPGGAPIAHPQMAPPAAVAASGYPMHGHQPTAALPQAPTGYPQASAPMAAYPGNMPPIPR